MEFYFRKDGKTLGPLSVFRVREQFEESKLVATDMGWHEGMEEWKPISEIPALQILLPRSEEELAKETADQAMEDAVLDPLERLDRENDPATEAPRPATRPIRDVAMEQEIQQTILLARQRNNWAWQRFLARFIDLLFFSLLVLAAGAQFGILEWGEITIPRFVAMMAAPFIWIPVEAFCLTRWGATPGKMMLGIRVENADGSRLNFRQALSRSVDVWFVGCGMQLQYLDVLMKVLAMVRYRQLGETSWDTALGLRVVHRPISSMGISLAVLVVATTFVLRAYMFFHSPLPSHLSAEERKFWSQVHQSQTTVPVTPPSDAPTPSRSSDRIY